MRTNINKNSKREGRSRSRLPQFDKYTQKYVRGTYDNGWSKLLKLLIKLLFPLLFTDQHCKICKKKWFCDFQERPISMVWTITRQDTRPQATKDRKAMKCHGRRTQGWAWKWTQNGQDLLPLGLKWSHGGFDENSTSSKTDTTMFLFLWLKTDSRTRMDWMMMLEFNIIMSVESACQFRSTEVCE